MMPSRSPRWTSSVTSRTAVRPPKRFVTRSSVSTGEFVRPSAWPVTLGMGDGGAAGGWRHHGGADRYPRADARGQAGEALREEPDDHDEERAVDDEVDAREPGLHARERGAQVGL